MYRKPKRPIWKGPHFGHTDWQGVIPRGWCPQCGAEIFKKGKTSCFRCKEVQYVHKK